MSMVWGLGGSMSLKARAALGEVRIILLQPLRSRAEWFYRL